MPLLLHQLFLLHLTPQNAPNAPNDLDDLDAQDATEIPNAQSARSALGAPGAPALNLALQLYGASSYASSIPVGSSYDVLST